MPLLKIETNQTVSDEAAQETLGALTDLVAQELSKPKEYIQVLLHPRIPMAFAGTTEPSAFVELRALGLPAEKTKALSGAICAALEQRLGLAADRVFINFADVPPTHWGWNGATFG